MEIHFYESIYTLVNKEGAASGSDVYYTCWHETEEAINKKQEIILTTQMGMLSTALFDKGYRVFVHPVDERPYEIKLGDNNTHTYRQIRLGHNLFNLWLAGEFVKTGDTTESLVPYAVDDKAFIDNLVKDMRKEAGLV